MMPVIPPKTLREIADGIDTRLMDIEQLVQIATQHTDDVVSTDVLLRGIKRTTYELYALHQELDKLAADQAKRGKA